MKMDKKQGFLIVGGSAFILILVLLFVFGNAPKEEELLWEVVDSSSTTDLEESMNSGVKEATILVDIKGAIKKPGVYELSSDSRLNELILLAGGFTVDAEERQLNLAEKLNDQQMIYVPNKDEINFSMESIQENEAKQASSSTDLININTADLTELQQLIGIGPSKAQAIISYREENGPFQAIEGLLEVNGFGEKTFEKLKSMIKI